MHPPHPTPARFTHINPTSVHTLRVADQSSIHFLSVTDQCSAQIQVGNLYFNSSKIGYITYIRSPDSSGISVAIIALIIVVILVIFALIILLVIMKRQQVHTSQFVCLFM